MFDTSLPPHRIRTHTNPPSCANVPKLCKKWKRTCAFREHHEYCWVSVCHVSDQIIDLNILHCLLHSIHSYGRHFFFLLLYSLIVSYFSIFFSSMGYVRPICQRVNKRKMITKCKKSQLQMRIDSNESQMNTFPLLHSTCNFSRFQQIMNIEWWTHIVTCKKQSNKKRKRN